MRYNWQLCGDRALTWSPSRTPRLSSPTAKSWKESQPLQCFFFPLPPLPWVPPSSLLLILHLHLFFFLPPSLFLFILSFFLHRLKTREDNLWQPILLELAKKQAGSVAGFLDVLVHGHPSECRRFAAVFGLAVCLACAEEWAKNFKGEGLLEYRAWRYGRVTGYGGEIGLILVGVCLITEELRSAEVSFPPWASVACIHACLVLGEVFSLHPSMAS